MKIDILTLFPDYFTTPLSQSLIAKARENGILDIKIWNIRDFAKDKHKVVDDEPYGGGVGMVMKIEPVVECLEEVERQRGKGLKILLTPSGEVFNHKTARDFGNSEHLIFICGRYEGIDARIENFIDREISIGDYIIMGGEVATLVVLEASVRFVKGVVGKDESVIFESFSDGLLEYPQYTRPYDFRGFKVPDILISGDHKKITEWRTKQAILKTSKLRPELLKQRENS
ncbi:MAG: tRNA (guanosine(37)-N1)-methyltransferase TrmD [Proteobacteria bacterium]|nr:tRNA (guanosine(37)-N1)-methyltransferase TrmD [Pseudomonadota bacterium]